MTVAGHQITFDRDQAGREIHRSLAGQTSLDQVWDPSGRLITQTLAAAPAQPDGAGVSSLAARLGGGVRSGHRGPELLQERHYEWKPGGRLSGIEDHLTGARSFDLDPTGRITAVAGTGWAESYAYDPAGNITAVTAPAVPDGAGQRRQYSGTRLLRAGPTRYSYDRQGRLVTKTTKRISHKPETWHYAWDAEDRMVGVTTPDGTRWRYLYDGLGRRVAKQRLGDEPDGAETVAEETWFAWDGTTLAEQTTTCESRAGATTSWTYDGLAPIAQVNTTAGTRCENAIPTAVDEATQAEIDAEFFSIVTDVIGTPTELVNADGDLVWHARRTLWGAPADPDVPEPIPLRFPGQYADAETGLYYNLNRYYAPNTARYTSPDPLGLAPSPNPSGYVDNPTTTIDPLGLAPCHPNAAETGEDRLYAYRGVGRDHPGYEDALQGRVNPRDPNGSATPEQHNLGNTSESPYTSWTRNPAIAKRFAGDDGVMLRVPRGAGSPYKFEWSPDVYFEDEILIRGPVSGAEVLR